MKLALRIVYCCCFILCQQNLLEAKTHHADYVVVGVGTAGAVVAKLLSDNHENSVVALHIGENLTEDPLIKYSDNAIVTVLSALLGQLDPNLNPLYETGFSVPQPRIHGREIFWAVATPEGGASSINAGAYVRGTNELYAHWEAIAGHKWSVNRILKIFKGLETYDGKTTDPGARGCCGPVDVRQDPRPSQVSKKFTKAMMKGAHLPFVLDYNDPHTPIGISSQLQYTQSIPDGIYRVSSATAYLNESVMTPEGYGVHGRKLRVLFNSPALRTIWDGNKAIGVEYSNDGEVKQVMANKGVIVCAGLLSSPFLLHSGIGPAPLLNSLHIPVVYENSNVGQGLADQPHIVLLFTSNPADTELHTAGIFSQIGHFPDPEGDPNVRIYRMSTVNPVPGITSLIFDLLQPKSRGSVTINSPDPLAKPLINYGAFSSKSDLATYIRGFRTYVKSINEAFLTIDPTYRLIYPDPVIIDDTVLLTEFIKNEIGSNQHWQSHCRMAPLELGGVVDSRGSVYGVQNLFVADNSIVPLCMDGSPMQSGYLIGNNVALMLLEE